MKLKLINKTSWDTDDLRKLIIKCLESKGWDPKRKHRTDVVPARRPFLSGWAYYNSNHVRMKVPTTCGEEFNTKSFVKIFFHEVDHNLGLHHREMVNSSLIPLPPYADTFVVRRQEPKAASPSPKSDPRKKYEKVVLRIDEKERGIKRLQNALKKLKRKKTYYQKKYGF